MATPPPGPLPTAYPAAAAAVAPSPRRRRRLVWGAFGALAFLVAVGATFTAYRLVLASGDREDSKVPAEANVYAASSSLRQVRGWPYST